MAQQAPPKQQPMGLRRFLYGRGPRGNRPAAQPAAPTQHAESRSDVAEPAHRTDSTGHTADTQADMRTMMFILFTVFCERFCFYGIREVLIAFLTEKLSYSKSAAAGMLHTFSFFYFVFPLVGALLGDSYLGKRRSVKLLCIVYAVGAVMLAISSSMSLPLTGMLVMLIALAGGGMRPCITALGGDQYNSSLDGGKALRAFYCWFYLAINAAAACVVCLLWYVEPTIIFWICSITICLALGAFVAEMPNFKDVVPVKHALENSFKCILYALRQRRANKGKTVGHWLDNAGDKFNKELIEDVKMAVRLVIVLIPAPIFWALYYQQFTTWKAMTEHTNCFWNDRQIRLEHINPICVVILLPLVKFVVYPLCDIVNVLRKPTHRMIVGGLFAGIAFLLAYNAAVKIEQKPRTPGGDWDMPIIEGCCRLVLFNNMGCDQFGNLVYPDKNISTCNIPTFWWHGVYNHKLQKELEAYYNHTDCAHKGYKATMGIFISPLKFTVNIQQPKPVSFYETFERHEGGLPLIRVFSYLSNEEKRVEFHYKSVKQLEVKSGNVSKLVLPLPGEYTVQFDGNNHTIDFPPRTLTYVAIHSFRKENTRIREYHPLYNDRYDCDMLVAQYVALAVAEVLYVVSGIEFVYVNSPAVLKCTLQAFWLIAVALGILLTIVLERFMKGEKMSIYLLACAILMFLDVGLFGLLAKLQKFL